MAGAVPVDPRFVADSSVAARLGLYDAKRLLSEYRALEDLPWTAQPGRYHGGGWVGITLIGRHGRTFSAEADAPSTRQPQRSALLEKLPAFSELLSGLPGRVTCARIMRVAPGAEIGSHVDPWHSLEAGLLRLHVPITCAATAPCLVEDARVPWADGELWYVDFSRPHRVANGTAGSRVNLIVDVEVTNELLARLPAKAVENRTPFVRPAARRLTDEDRQRLFTVLLISTGLTGYVDGSLRASIVAGGDGLMVLADGKPWAGVDIFDKRSLHVWGTPPGFTLEYNDSYDQVSLVLRGLSGRRLPLRLILRRAPQ
jgi:hypothetical protein